MVDGRWEGNGKRSEGVKETAPGGEQEQMMNGRVSGWRQLWRAEWRLKKKSFGTLLPATTNYPFSSRLNYCLLGSTITLPTLCHSEPWILGLAQSNQTANYSTYE
jgi:hypothetical protein